MAGAKMSDIILPEIFTHLAEAHGRAMDYEVSMTGLFDVTNHRDQISTKFRERFDAGSRILSSDYDDALKQAKNSRSALSDAMGDCDVPDMSKCTRTKPPSALMQPAILFLTASGHFPGCPASMSRD